MLSIRTVYSDPQRTKEDLETHLLALRANLPKPFNGTEQQDADELFDKLVDKADSTSTITVSFMNPSLLSMKFRRSKLTLLPLLEFPFPKPMIRKLSLSRMVSWGRKKSRHKPGTNEAQ